MEYIELMLVVCSALIDGVRENKEQTQPPAADVKDCLSLDFSPFLQTWDTRKTQKLKFNPSQTFQVKQLNL